MNDFDTVAEIWKKISAQLNQPQERDPAVTCTRRFNILPLRYAAVGGIAGQRQHLPELPEPLLRHPLQVGELSHSGYAIRTLREGFLHVLVKRKSTGLYQWEGAYQVNASAALTRFDPAAPEPAADPPGTIRPLHWGFALYDLDDVVELRLLFSPDRLTVAVLERYRRLDHGNREHLPAIDIAPFAAPSCPVQQPHVLTHDQLDWVADFAAQNNPALKQLLDAQVFQTPHMMPKVAVHLQLKPAEDQRIPRGVAVVVDDAIGITQELNGWRNAALEQVKDWLDAPAVAAPGTTSMASNERKLLVAQAFTELQRTFTERKMAALADKDHQLRRQYLSTKDEAAALVMPSPRWERGKEAILNAGDALNRPALEARAQSGEFARQFNERYLPRVDELAMQSYLNAFDARCQLAQALAEDRSADHLRWLQHPRLLAALTAYDESDVASGLCFSHQTGLCMIGMSGVPSGSQLLSQWWQATAVEPGNLALRAYTFNQHAIAQVLKATLERLTAQSEAGSDLESLNTALLLSKELAAEFDRVDGFLDRLSQSGQINTAGALAWLGDLGREMMRTGSPNHLDRALHRRLSTFLTASLGSQALNLRLTELNQTGQSASPGRVQAPILRSLHAAYADNLRNARSNSFYKLRVASALLLLEASLLLMQGRRDEMDRRFVTQVLGNVLFMAAAGLELLAVGTEQVLNTLNPNAAAARGAQISLGRFRLWGAGLATAGGLVSIGWDVVDARDAFKKAAKASSSRKGEMGSAYTVRAIATVALLSGQGGIAFAQAGAYFRWLALKTDHTKAKVMFHKLAKSSARLAANQTAMLLLSRMFWIGGAFVIGTTIVLLILDDDALEKWCDRCCFSRDKKSKQYAKDEDELDDLFGAIKGVL